MLSRFHLILDVTDGRTDRQTYGRTDRFAISVSRVSMLPRDKNPLINGHGTNHCIAAHTNTPWSVALRF